MSKIEVARPPRWSAQKNVAEICVLDWTLEETCHGFVLDVSEGGACIRCGLRVPVGSSVELRIMLHDTQYELLAEVRWCRGADDAWDCGMRFLAGEADPGSEFGKLLVHDIADSPRL